MRVVRENKRVLLVAVLAFAISLPLLSMTMHSADADVDDSLAVRAALADEELAAFLATRTYDRTDVIALDAEATRVSFFNGPKLVAEAALDQQAQVTATSRLAAGALTNGNAELQSAPALIVGMLLYVIVLLRRPLMSMHNFDLALIGSFSVTVLTFNKHLPMATIVVAALLICLLTARCLWVTMRARRPVGEFLVLDRADPRLLSMVLCAALAGVLIATIPGGTTGDIANASMSGATELLEGRIPYGNIADGIVHGDTYPLLAYLVYTPAALLLPVQSLFDNLDGALWIAAIALMIGALGIHRAALDVGSRAFAMRQAIAWLICPPLLIAATSGSNSLPTATFCVLAIATFTKAAQSSAWLSAGAWVKAAPVFALPIWLARFRGGDLLRAASAPLLITLAMFALLLAMEGFDGPRMMFEAIMFQSERGSQYSLATVTGLQILQPAMMAAALALVSGATVAVIRSPELATDRARICALVAATLLLCELGTGYWNFQYLAWVLPFLTVALLWPHATTRLPGSDRAPERATDSGA